MIGFTDGGFIEYYNENDLFTQFPIKTNQGDVLEIT